MAFYTKQHEFYCGIDLHAKRMYFCIVSQAGEVVFHRNLKTQPEGSRPEPEATATPLRQWQSTRMCDYTSVPEQRFARSRPT